MTNAEFEKKLRQECESVKQKSIKTYKKRQT